MDITMQEISSRLLRVTAGTYFQINCGYQVSAQVPPLHNQQLHFSRVQPSAVPQTPLDQAKAISHLPGWHYSPQQER